MKVGRTQGSRDRPGAWPGLQGWAELGPEMLGCLLSSVLLHAKTVTSFTKSESHFAAFLQSMIILPLKKNNKTFSAMPTSKPRTGEGSHKRLKAFSHFSIQEHHPRGKEKGKS
jgi:hypothetical protein